MACEVVTKGHSTLVNAGSSGLVNAALTQHQLAAWPPRDNLEAGLAESLPGCTLHQHGSCCALQAC